MKGKMKSHLLDVSNFSANGLTSEETRYLKDLVDVFKEKETMQKFLDLMSYIKTNQDPVLKTNILNDFFKDVEDYLEQNLMWKRNEDLRNSITSKLVSFGDDYQRFLSLEQFS
jgi:uncharacterized protein YbaP (TraB family)